MLGSLSEETSKHPQLGARVLEDQCHQALPVSPDAAGRYFPSKGSPTGRATTTADGALSVYATDLDGAGQDGIACGQFAAPRQLATASGAIAVFATDRDGDGDADVVFAASGDDRVTWLENLGGAQFGAPEEAPCMSPLSVSAADLDDDGDADLLASSDGLRLARDRPPPADPPGWTARFLRSSRIRTHERGCVVLGLVEVTLAHVEHRDDVVQWC